MNKIIWIIVIVVLILGGILIFRNQPTPDPVPAPIVETIPEPAPAQNSFTTAPSEVKSFTVLGSNFKFSLAEIKVKQGDTVKITFKNSGGTHDWRLDEFNAKTQILKDGQEETIEFVADKKGAFEYYCSIGSHRAMGMKGNLIVE